MLFDRVVDIADHVKTHSINRREFATGFGFHTFLTCCFQVQHLIRLHLWREYQYLLTALSFLPIKAYYVVGAGEAPTAFAKFGNDLNAW